MNKQIHDYLTVITAVLAAMLLASHQLSQSSTFGVFGAYAYWLFRVLIEVGCFFAVLVAIEKYFEGVFAPWLEVVVAIVISLVPFTVDGNLSNLLIELSSTMGLILSPVSNVVPNGS